MSQDTKKFSKQLLLISILVLVPVVMIFINGRKALDGILWSRDQQKQQIDESLVVTSQLRFGFYNPSQNWKKDYPWEMELLYISWLHFDKDTLRNQLESILDRGLNPFLTIEPWAEDGDENVLKSIVNGNYDELIGDLQNALRHLKDTVFISWGHEMDQDLTERYSWSAQNPEDFVAAYRYFHQSFNTDEFKLKWIWSPVAKETTINYWPGDDVVDGVGVPVYAFPSWDVKHYGYIRRFEETFDEKYDLVKVYNKPVFIKEFGVSGPEHFKREWFEHAFTQLNNYPLLNSILFFNDEDTPGVWGGDMSTPDWRIPESLALELVMNYKAAN